MRSNAALRDWMFCSPACLRPPSNAVAIVSGRTVADLDRLLAPHRLAVAGIHGLERRRADGKVIRAPAAPDWMQGARNAMGSFAATHPGLLLENKGASLALHYRSRPELEDAVQQFVAGLDLPVAAERLQGRKVMEVKPRQMNKGTAIRAFMSETALCRPDAGLCG